MFTFTLKQKKRKHLKGKIEIVKKKIWDLEFLLEKYKAMREGFRTEYDRIREQVDASQTRLAEELKKEDPDKTIKTNLEEMIKRFEPDMEQLKKQIDEIDGQIESDGGVLSTIESYRTVIDLMNGYIKKI